MTDNAPFILIKDNLHPEDSGMLQAMYSRSPASVVDHLKKVDEVGSGKFMDQFYKGYGHKSIGDCGNTKIFIENVSMLVAKAIQDSGLYNGQEASTRYLDFSTQRIHDPFNHPYTTAIQQGWMDLYNETLPKIVEALKKAYPFSQTSSVHEKTYEKTIKAKAFDIVRSLLPIGATTNLSFDTSLSHARDHLRFLYNHPLHEVHQVVNTIHDQLYKAYPNSFDETIVRKDGTTGLPTERDEMFFSVQGNDLDNYYLHYNTVKYRLSPEAFKDVLDGKVSYTTTSIDIDSINFDHADVLRRPGRVPLPRYLTQYGMYNFYFTLDFGSFRDIQRHRNGFCPNPLITSHFGFYSWYDEQFKTLLSITDYRVLRNRINELIERADMVGQHITIFDQYEQQYLYPMGITCVCQFACGLPQAVYVTELRSELTVHGSLRQKIHLMGDILEYEHADLNLFMNREKEAFTMKRGDQDIVAKT